MFQAFTPISCLWPVGSMEFSCECFRKVVGPISESVNLWNLWISYSMQNGFIDCMELTVSKCLLSLVGTFCSLCLPTTYFLYCLKLLCKGYDNLTNWEVFLISYSLQMFFLDVYHASWMVCRTCQWNYLRLKFFYEKMYGKLVNTIWKTWKYYFHLVIIRLFSFFFARLYVLSWLYKKFLEVFHHFSHSKTVSISLSISFS